MPAFILNLSNLLEQTKFIGVGITTKQYDSIEIFKSTTHRLLNEEDEIEFNINKLNNTKFSERFRNIITFICKPKPTSLIYHKYN